MDKEVNKTIKITQLKRNENSKITKFLYKTGTIIGTKKIRNQFTVFIIELKDYSRIWMLKQEITVLSKQQ
uniref:Cytochrome b6-f complex subunit PetP n=1 Tax=Hypnea pannosa TaxID=105607 RepID=A0A4D6WX80_9FLOR|nr:cytochrome b6-f complex subunit PetP [Hypnea pannosa]